MLIHCSLAVSDGCVRAICNMVRLTRLTLIDDDDDDAWLFELLSQEMISVSFSMVNAVRHKNLFTMRENNKSKKKNKKNEKDLFNLIATNDVIRLMCNSGFCCAIFLKIFYNTIKREHRNRNVQ